jgi:hypothetical protein
MLGGELEEVCEVTYWSGLFNCHVLKTLDAWNEALEHMGWNVP